MSIGAEMDLAAAAMAGWTACPAYGPGEELVFPAPSVDPANPASVLSWDVAYEEIEQGDFAGGKTARGSVEFSVWQEGDDGRTVRAHMAALEALFVGTASGVTWRPGIPGEWEKSPPWYGRVYAVPFIRFS